MNKTYALAYFMLFSKSSIAHTHTHIYTNRILQMDIYATIAEIAS